MATMNFILIRYLWLLLTELGSVAWPVLVALVAVRCCLSRVQSQPQQWNSHLTNSSPSPIAPFFHSLVSFCDSHWVDSPSNSLRTKLRRKTKCGSHSHIYYKSLPSPVSCELKTLTGWILSVVFQCLALDCLVAFRYCLGTFRYCLGTFRYCLVPCCYCQGSFPHCFVSVTKLLLQTHSKYRTHITCPYLLFPSAVFEAVASPDWLDSLLQPSCDY